MVTVATKFGIGHVVAAGIIGGILFAAFEMLAAATLMGSQASFMPLRMIGAMLLGAGAVRWAGTSGDRGCSSCTGLLLLHSSVFSTLYPTEGAGSGTEPALLTALGPVLRPGS
jgi:hypothetical protein